MNTRIRIFFVVCSAAFSCGFSPVRGQSAEANGVLDEIRAAMAERDMAGAKAKLVEAAKIDGDTAFSAERTRLTLLQGYLEDFWKSVDEGAKSLQSVDELKIGDVLVSVVEYQPGLLVLRVKGENKRYTVKTLPAKVALTLAERVLKPNDPQNKVFFGTFLLMDGKGDREIARKLWTEAQKANVDVSSLLPELGNAPVASLPMEIPPVTSIMRKLLAPASWTLRRQEGGRMVRDSLKDNAEQTAAGYLQVTAPSGAGEAQLIYSRKLAANFGCRIILQNVGDGQVFGLFAAETLAAAYQVPLPKGSVMVEFARQGGTFQCRLNQKEVTVESRGDVVPNMAGMVGLTLPADAKCVVAWFELQTR